MTQDFAKIRPEPLVERKSADAPHSWFLVMTWLLLGVVLGIAGSVVLYLSGAVPPVNPRPAAVNSEPSEQPVPPAVASGASPEQSETPEAGEQELELDFYNELPRYEVSVEAVPVDLGPEDPDQELETPYLLQTGAFRRYDLAQAEMARQQALGHRVIVKQQDLEGRPTLYLLQSGPYRTVGEINEVEQLLRRNQIESRRMHPR